MSTVLLAYYTYGNSMADIRITASLYRRLDCSNYYTLKHLEILLIVSKDAAQKSVNFSSPVNNL